MLLADFFELTYIPRKLRGKSEGSIRLYRLCLMQFARSLGRLPAVTDLTEDNVLLHLSKRSDVAAPTRNKELSQLLALWRYACQRKLLNDWPDILPETEPERVPIAWMPDELARLISTAEAIGGRVGDVPANAWWSALIRISLDTGERIGAVRSIQWSWLQGEWLLVPAEVRKGKTRDRRYSLSPETLSAIFRLRSLVGSRKDMFPWPYGETYLWNRYGVILKTAGLPQTRKHQLHCLRKTFGSVVHAAGMDAQAALDHADRRTTQRYLDPRLSRETKPSEVLAAYLANPRPAPRTPNQKTG
jgi:integrase